MTELSFVVVVGDTAAAAVDKAVVALSIFFRQRGVAVYFADDTDELTEFCFVLAG